MKLRLGFVSNSSCASFTVSLASLSKFQLAMIRNHIEAAQFLAKIDPSYGICPVHFEMSEYEIWEEDKWALHETDDGLLMGYTSMDNFDLRYFAEYIGVSNAKWETGHFTCPWGR